MKVAITGGAGYVGSVLVPHLLQHGYQVTVVDRFWYGREVLDQTNDALRLVEADVRDAAAMQSAFRGMDAVIHLACISNDPSFELNPQLGKSINLDAFAGILRAVRDQGVSRYIYASSSSVYGVRAEPDVHEETPCQPLTDYSAFKLECERILQREGVGDACYTIVRPATVCGYGRRLRLDLTVNILTIHALVNHKIRVFGGTQLRPNLNILDMAAAYRMILEAPADLVAKQVFNVGYENWPVGELARQVRDTLHDEAIEVVTEPSDDLRSYHISSEKVRQVLGFVPAHSITDAVVSLRDAYREARIPHAMDDERYYNVKWMNRLLRQGDPMLSPVAG